MTDPSAPAGLTYHDALRALAERGRFGIRLGLGRTRALLRELDHPERSVRGALIAGTNGKGSVLALADSALRAAGYRVGTTPKPHLVTYRERIQVDGRPIAPDDFARLVDRVLAAADRIAPTSRRADRVRAADRGRLRPLRRGPPRPGAGRGRPRRATRCDPRLGRRRGGRDQRRPRPHGPPRRHDRQDRPREGRDHRARRPRRHRRARRRAGGRPASRAARRRAADRGRAGAAAGLGP